MTKPSMYANLKYSANGAWWMPILEKAYAKLNQSYTNLAGGPGELALHDLTGMPIKSYRPS